MKVLSEDNPYMTTSILLAKYFNIEYKSGNSGLRAYTKDKTSNRLIIFLDVVPDNPSTLGLYRAMRSDIVRNGLYGKVFLYPIVCTEYFVLLALWEMGICLEYSFPWMDEVENAVKERRTILEYIPRGVCNYKGSFRSFEKQCKLLLDNSSMRFHNVNMENPEIKRLYQDISYYLNDDKHSTYDKAMHIAINFPVFIPKPDIFFSNGLKSVEELEEHCNQYQLFTDNWLKSDISKSLGEAWWEKYEKTSSSPLVLKV